MIRSRAWALLLFGITALLPAFALAQERTTIFAAASLSGVLEQIIPADRAVFSYAGSGAIARQLAAGAPADVVVLANTDWMDWLLAAGITTASKIEIIATNQLVVVAPKGAAPLEDAARLVTALGDGRLAMGQHQAVPAGQYAHAWLTAEGLWDTLAPRTLETQNVRAALSLVTREEAPLGVVYASDAARAHALSVVYAVPADRHAPIVYPAAALTPKGAEVLTALRSPEARQILVDNGFGPAP